MEQTVQSHEQITERLDGYFPEDCRQDGTCMRIAMVTGELALKVESGRLDLQQAIDTSKHKAEIVRGQCLGKRTQGSASDVCADQLICGFGYRGL